MSDESESVTGPPPSASLAIPSPNWEDLRSFLETARCGSFTAAAKQLGVSINSVRRRVAQLERSFSRQLIVRTRDGIRLTPHGVEVMIVAKKMEDTTFGLLAFAGKPIADRVETVRLGAQDGLGSFWIAPRLAEYHKLNPDILIDLFSVFRTADLQGLGADITLQIGRPPGPDLGTLRLGRIHLVPTVSTSFLETHGMPQTLDEHDELRAHRLTLLDRPLSLEMYSRIFPGVAQEDIVRLRTNNPMVQIMSLLSGAGFAWTPTYVHAVLPHLHVVPVGSAFSSDIWLARKRSSGERPASIERLWGWLRELFVRDDAPWFRDEYVAPSEFPSSERAALFSPAID